MPLFDLKPLQAAVAASAIAQPLAPVADYANRRIGSFFIQRGSAQLAVDARRKKHHPHSIYLYAGRLDNLRQGSGLGTAFMHELFDIADTAGVEHVMVRASEIGRYAHAANYVQCHAAQWAALQEELLAALDDYHGQVARAHLPEAGRQAKRAEAAILQADGALGPLVDTLRAEPNLAAGAGRLSTLAKHLFLSQPETRSYEGYWDEAGRQRARQRVQKRAHSAGAGKKATFTPG